MADTIEKFFDDDTKVEHDDVVIGIDLGTCNSCCCVWRNGYAEIIADEYGNRTIPSVVAFTDRSTLIGVDARNYMTINSSNTFYEFKRLIGKKITDHTIASDQKFLSYTLCYDETQSEHNMVRILRNTKNGDVRMSPEELSSYILIKMKQMASNYLGFDVSRAVISVPAYFNDAQRRATRDAATIAGLECIRIISEPIASALAYGLHKTYSNSDDAGGLPKRNKNIIVYDLGGGTLDVSLVEIDNGTFDVIGSSGNTHLGGVDFDNRLYDYCVNIFGKRYPDVKLKDIPTDALFKLRKSCENAKKVLSTSSNATIGVTNFYNENGFIVNVTREEFNNRCNDLMMMCLKPLNDVLEGCKVGRDMVDEIILVGGMTRVPAIRDSIKKFFGKEPNCSVNPDETVAVGAAIQGYILSHKSDPFSDSVTLLDSTQLSLGVETMDGIMCVVVPRGTLMPASEKKLFSNDVSGETSVCIRIYEGERKLTSDNFYVGEFELTGLTPSPRGYHKIEVTFTIDVNGMITVSAHDLRGNGANTIRVNSNNGRLPQATIEKLVQSAKQFEITDKENKKKHKMHHELLEMCKNIMLNLRSGTSNISQDEIDDIVCDIKNIANVLNEPYDKIDMEFYNTTSKRMNSKYFALIIRNTPKHDNEPTGETPNDIGTTIFTDECENSKTFTKIEAAELGYTERIDSDTLNELKQIRSTLIELCQSTLDIINTPGVLLNTVQKDELRDYIDDTLVWVHVHQKIEMHEYTDKLNKITQLCKEYVLQQENQLQCDSKNELHTLCIALKNALDSNLLPINTDNEKLLNSVLEETQQWLQQNDDNDATQCQAKIDYINSICNRMYDAEIKNETKKS